MCAPSPEVSFRLHAIAWGVSEIKIDPKDGRSCEREEVKIFNMFFLLQMLHLQVRQDSRNDLCEGDTEKARSNRVGDQMLARFYL